MGKRHSLAVFVGMATVCVVMGIFVGWLGWVALLMPREP